MKFVDEVSIEVKAGHGGSGAKSFRREKFVPFGGPDGGDGGKGGSVIAQATTNVHTLLDFQFIPTWQAKNGGKGEGNNRHGANGEDLIIRVPVGCQIFNQDTGTLVCDLDEPGKQHVICAGGRGGKGNAFFATPTNQVPEHFQPGEPGESGTYLLSLKLVADIGLIGFPNAGKSTLISVISAARPKIADYPFTTLIPNLGVVRGKGRSFVVADIPGLIPGASQGRGLGIKFLKHVERTSALVHLIDPAQLDSDGKQLSASESYDLINKELLAFSPEIAARPQIVALTKADVCPTEVMQEAQQQLQKRGITVYCISAAAQQGIPELIAAMEQLVTAAKPTQPAPTSQTADAEFDF